MKKILSSIALAALILAGAGCAPDPGNVDCTPIIPDEAYDHDSLEFTHWIERVVPAHNQDSLDYDSNIWTYVNDGGEKVIIGVAGRAGGTVYKYLDCLI